MRFVLHLRQSVHKSGVQQAGRNSGFLQFVEVFLHPEIRY